MVVALRLPCMSAKAGTAVQLRIAHFGVNELFRPDLPEHRFELRTDDIVRKSGEVELASGCVYRADTKCGWAIVCLILLKESVSIPLNREG